MLSEDGLWQEKIRKNINLALSELSNPDVKVKDYSFSDDDGFPDYVMDILDKVKKLPPVIDFEPFEIREAQLRRGYPFDHEKDIDVNRIDIEIPLNSHDLKARMYVPKSLRDKDGLSGALIYFHGGGFVLGSIESHDGTVAQIAYQSKLIVVSVDYRLAPEYPFPTGLLDAQHSYNWLVENAHKYNIDKSRIAIGGDSAGANLAAACCKLNRDQEKPLPAMQILIYPSTIGNNTSESRERLKQAPIIPSHVIKWMHDHYISKEKENDERFNILSASDLSDLPPAFVLTAGYDPLLDEGYDYSEKLKAHGVIVRHSCYINMFHGFYTYGVLPESQNAISETAKILREALGEGLERKYSSFINATN